jgi:hypothetical protein
MIAPRRDHGDWAGDGDALNVFVPGLMGAGILLSGAILVSDGVRKLLPSRGIRRRLNVVRGVRRIVVDLADAAGMSIEERNLMRRERRSVWLYLVVVAVALPLAFLVGRWGFNAYNSVGSSLEGNAMAIAYGMIAAVALASAGLVAATLLFPRVNPPLPVAWLVERTPLGRLSAPPDEVAERARLLIPSLDKGART